MNEMRSSKSGCAALCCALALLATGCNSDDRDSRASSRTQRPTPEATVPAPPVKRDTKMLEPSTVEISGVGASDPDAGANVSQAESRQVESSSARVEQLLSDFNARQTDQGLVIDLPENILFDFDKAELKSEAKPTLDKINELISFYKDAPVEINGHTDSKGADAYNQNLSEKRAGAVKDYLTTTFDVTAARIKAVGYGESKPVAPNAKPDGADDPEGRQKNRRVEVVIKK